MRLPRIAACALRGSALAAPGRRLVAHSGPVAILAVLIGSNIGPMLLCRNENRWKNVCYQLGAALIPARRI